MNRGLSRLFGPIVVGFVLVGPTALASATTSATRVALGRWQHSIVHVRAPGRGCYHASYPALKWLATPCKVPPRWPLAPAQGAGFAPRWPLAPAPVAGSGPLGAPDAVGDGTDYSAVVAGTISQATGSFNNVSPGITETGQIDDHGQQLANEFTLQLNSQFFSSPACSDSSDPADCLGWQQFVYDTDSNMVFMQYWLISYDAACPSGWAPDGSGDCYINSAGSTYTGDPLTAADLASVTFGARAAAGGDDQVSLSVDSGTATMVSNSDDMLDLANSWNTTEFDVFGDGGGGQANFGPSTTLDPQITLAASSLQAPTCEEEGFTAETNNLNLSGTPALGNEGSPTIEFAQTNGTATVPSCATAAGSGPVETDTELSIAPSSPATNQTVTLTATVSVGPDIPSGSVAFDNGGAVISGCATRPVALNGSLYTATCQTSFTAASSPESLSATFTPSSPSLETSTSSADDLAIAPDSTATSLAVSTATPVVGRSVAYTATVTPSESGTALPSGSVEFLDGGSAISACSTLPLSTRTASCTVSYASTESHRITARYLGDVNFTSSTSSGQTVWVEPSEAQVKAALDAVLVPSGKAAKLAAILRARGYAYTFTAPSAGALAVDWEARVKRKTVLVAVTSRVIRAAKKASEELKLTSAGRELLRAASKVKIVSSATFTPNGTTSTTATRGFTLKR